MRVPTTAIAAAALDVNIDSATPSRPTSATARLPANETEPTTSPKRAAPTIVTVTDGIER